MRLVVTYLLVVVAFSGYSQTARDLTRSGNENYKIDSLTTAISNFEEAIKLDSKLDEARFNLGDAYYKQGKFADASSTFDELAKTTSNANIKSNAYYNKGNSLMEMQKFDEAMNSYKESMKANPKNTDARYNYEYARKKLAEQKKQEQQKKDDKNKDDQDKKNDKKDDKKDQNKDGDKDKKNQDKKDQDKKDQNNQDKKDDQKEQSDKNKQDQNKGDEEKKGDKNQEKPQNQKPQPNQMSKADAERLLKAMDENEKKTREKVALQKARTKSKKKSDKDW